jgi:hypothetical protein
MTVGGGGPGDSDGDPAILSPEFDPADIVGPASPGLHSGRFWALASSDGEDDGSDGKDRPSDDGEKSL